MARLRGLVPSLFLLVLMAPMARATLTPVVVPYAVRGTVDTDGDLTPDTFDNAPGVANDQQDMDADGIGDVIDPTPAMSNPSLGDPGLGLFAPTPITAGSHVFLPYTMTIATPPGGWGHIDLDFGADGIIDATYFGPLDSTTNLMDISPSLYSSALWDLNTPGTYTFQAWAVGPGRVSENPSIVTNVVVLAPEPGTVILLGASLVLVGRRRK